MLPNACTIYYPTLVASNVLNYNIIIIDISCKYFLLRRGIKTACQSDMPELVSLKTGDEQSLKAEYFSFGSHEITIKCRKSVQRTLNFKLTVQVQKEDLYESLRGWGGGYESDENESNEPQLASSSGDKDLLGLDVWPAAITLCEYLSKNESLVCRKRVIELGAGVGLPCLIAAKIGASEGFISDYDSRVVEHAHENAIECGLGHVCKGLVLDWRHLENLSDDHKHSYDVVLAADVMYISQIMPDFVKSMDYVMKQDGLAILTHQCRQSLVLDNESGVPIVIDIDVSFEKFKDLISDYGFEMKLLDQCDSEGFPGPMNCFALARHADVLEPLKGLDGVR